MISYAQNFEDIILERIFRDVGNGYYVDIGACHPIDDSVTYHFYLKGWQGINIEPQPGQFKELQRVRPNDTNLNLCIGSDKGRCRLYITTDKGTSTQVPELIKAYLSEGRVVDTVESRVITLNDLWENYVKTQSVNFLKIDVEGMEKDILKVTDFSLVTPEVIVIESVHPKTRKPTESEWEPYLLDHYTFLYFDGLNRFYRRNNFSLDEKTYSVPPNVFDNFTNHKEYKLRKVNKALKKRLSRHPSIFVRLKRKLSKTLRSAVKAITNEKRQGSSR